jgi:cold shock CspA family protein
MSQHAGVVTWISKPEGYGLVRRSGSYQDVVPFSLVGVEDHESLSKGEPVLFDLVQRGMNVCAENVTRTMGNLEAYQNFGGLYS